MRPLAILKRWLMRYVLVDEFCRDCGLRVDLTWTADKDTWERYAGANHPPLCMPCFSERARLAGVLLRCVPHEDSFRP